MSSILWKSLLISIAFSSSTLMSIAVANAESTLTSDSNVSEFPSQPTKTLNGGALTLTPGLLKLAGAKTHQVNTALLAQLPEPPLLPQSEISMRSDTKSKEQIVAAQPESLSKSTPVSPVANSPTDSSQESEIDQMVRYGKEGTGEEDDSVGQVTSVSQLRDVQPTDWAFQALQSLVERYGCIAGYPDGTFRGNRALTRYEFAAGLNACLDRVNELIAAGTSDLVRKEDIATLQQLQQEFATELAALRGRVDNLEAQTAQLEANQFSTTTKLVGEGVFALTDEFNAPVRTNTVFQDRVRLDFQTSFTGKDTLNTRLAAGDAQRLTYQNSTANGGYLPFGTFEGTQTFNVSSTGNNSVSLDWLTYYFPVGPAQAYVAAFGGFHNDYAPTTSPYFESFTGGTGALSVFAEDNAIYKIGGGSGAAITIPFGKPGTVLGSSSITGGYLASNAFRPLGNNASPTGGSGLFNGDYAALGQINFNYRDKFAIGGTYVNAYNSTGSGIFNLGTPENIVSSSTTSTTINGVVGTVQANDPSVLLTGGQRPIVTNSYGGEFAIRPIDKISISGWVDYTRATIIGRGNGDIWSYAAGVAFPDLGKQGSVLGFFGGVEPTLKSLRAAGAGTFSNNNAWHAEAFYKYQLNDYISITPGVIVLFDPGQNKSSADDVVGTLRTTFTF